MTLCLELHQLQVPFLESQLYLHYPEKFIIKLIEKALNSGEIAYVLVLQLEHFCDTSLDRTDILSIICLLYERLRAKRSYCCFYAHLRTKF